MKLQTIIKKDIMRKGDITKVSSELSAFLRFVKTGAAEDDFTEEISNAVGKAKDQMKSLASEAAVKS